MSKASLRITPGGIAATILVFIVAGVCVRLGFWQLDRLEWRTERNRIASERLALPVLPVTSADLDTAGLAYRRVELRGEFDNARAFVLAGRAHRGVPGVHVVTPLRLENGDVVLVNRGWLRASDAATVDLRPHRIDGPVRLTGMVIPFFAKRTPDDDDPRAGARSPIRVADPAAADDAAPVWFRPDDDAVRASLPYPVADFIVQALAEEGADAVAGQITPLGPPKLDRGPHLGYAIQWFSFAAIALIGWVIVVARRLTTPPSSSAADSSRRSSARTGPAARRSDPS